MQAVIDYQADTAVNTQRQAEISPTWCVFTPGAAQLCFVAGGLHRVDLASRRLTSEEALPDSVAMRGLVASEDSCNLVKVARPQLRIDSGILRT